MIQLGSGTGREDRENEMEGRESLRSYRRSFKENGGERVPDGGDGKLRMKLMVG